MKKRDLIALAINQLLRITNLSIEHYPKNRRERAFAGTGVNGSPQSIERAAETLCDSILPLLQAGGQGADDAAILRDIEAPADLLRSILSGSPSNAAKAARRLGIPLFSPAYPILRGVLNASVRLIVDQCNRFLRDRGLALSKSQELMMYYNMISFSALCPAFGRDFIARGETRDSLLALAALHPLVDNAFDRPDADPACLADIGDGISGAKPAGAMTGVAAAITALLDETIFRQYPRESNPDLVDLFLQLYRWQHESAREQRLDRPADLRALTLITLYKGGFSLSLAMRLILGSLSSSNARTLFALGALYQLIDDFQDLAADLEEGNATIYSCDLRARGSIDQSFLAGLRCQATFERLLCDARDVPHPATFGLAANLTARLYFVRFLSVHWALVSDGLKARLRRTAPSLDDGLIAALSVSITHDDVRRAPASLLLRV
jgi:hypothetical protein